MAISSDPQVALQDIQGLVAAHASRAKCELWDYDHRVRCGGVTSDGSTVEFDVVWRGLTEADFAMLGKELATAFRKAGEEP